MKFYNIPLILLFLLLSTTGLTSQWTYCPGSIQITGMGQNVSIALLDEITAVVAGGSAGSPKVYITTNGGLNFLNITGNITGPELYAVCILNVNTILAGDGGSNGGLGGNARIWRTSNMGANWSVVLSTGGTAGFINGIESGLNEPNFIFAMSDAPTGTNALIAVSVNGGANWSTTTIPAGTGLGVVGSVYCIDNQFYGFGSNGAARYYYTTNGGTLWTFQNLTVSGNAVIGAAFNSNKLNGVFIPNLSSTNINIVSSGPGGPLNIINIGGTGSGARNVKFAPGVNSCFLTRTSGTNSIMRSFISGANWSYMTTGGVQNIVSMDIGQETINSYGYAVSANSEVIRFTDYLNKIKNLGGRIPERFTIYQNYPNPFNPVTNIRYSLPKPAVVTIKIFNALGEIFSTPVNEYHIAGNYSVEFNAGELASGIYFYSIAAGDYHEAKKMILVK